jgi:hypothetical protein
VDELEQLQKRLEPHWIECVAAPCPLLIVAARRADGCACCRGFVCRVKPKSRETKLPPFFGNWRPGKRDDVPGTRLPRFAGVTVCW